MKCPNCGFVSYPGLTQCKKCGCSLVFSPRESSFATDTSLIAEPETAQESKQEANSPPSANMDPAQSKTHKEPPQDTGLQSMPDDIEIGFDRDLREHKEDTAMQPGAEEPRPWRQELSERVQSFRQRRARLRNEPSPEENLDLNFGQREANELTELDTEKILEFPQEDFTVDAEIAPPVAPRYDVGHLDAETMEKGAERSGILDSALIQAGEIAIEHASLAGDHLEIVVGPTELDAQAAASQLDLQVLSLAPLGRRFLAGVVDGLVLLIGVGLFAFIFSRAGGHLTPVPLNIAIAAIIAVIFVLAYFGLFIALTFSTPGLTWMGIEVRNMEGSPPTLRESFLRAFGYLVSISAFFMGFLWALVDSDGLTWHDRISGSFLTPMRQEAPVEGVESSV